MDNSEKKSVFKLVLSTKGKKILEDRLLKATNEPISLIIALGDGGRAASPDDIELHNLKIQVKPSLVAADSELKQGLHINAIFPASGDEFDIKEIGLIIDNDQKGILLGRYANEEVIAKMTPQVDLLLDIVVDIGSYSPTSFTINSADYKPEFSLAKATEHRYGNVRFASINDITEKKTNLALSIDVLNYANIFPKSALRDSWSEPKMFNLAGQIAGQITGKKDKIVDFSIIGLSYIPRQKDQLCILLVPKKSITQETKQIISFFYSLDTGPNEKIDNYTFFNYSLCNAFPINKANFLVSVKNNNTFHVHDFKVKDVDSAGLTDSKSYLTIKVSPGSVFYFNDYVYALAGLDTHLDTIEYKKKKKKEQENKNLSFTLINKRKKPLIHLIQDKVYILGGSLDSEENYSSVEILDPINNIVFAPFTSQISDISNTDNITSCVLENKIYIFFIKQFAKSYQEEKFYYCYDYLGNNWKKNVIYDNVQLENPEPNLQGKAIIIGDEIYLFFTNTIQNDTQKFELSLIKLRPI
ncbi:MAG: hypothetical protein V4471_02605 [Pseudomonadota bacterium]